MSMAESRTKIEVRNVIPGHGLVVDTKYPCFRCEKGIEMICADCLEDEKTRTAFYLISYLKQKGADITEEDVDYIKKTFNKYDKEKAVEIVKKKFRII